MTDSTIPGSDRRATDYGANFNRLKAELETKKSRSADLRRQKNCAEAAVVAVSAEYRRAVNDVQDMERRVAKARKKTELAEQPLSWFFMKACENMGNDDGSMLLFRTLRADAEQLKANAILAVEFDKKQGD